MPRRYRLGKREVAVAQTRAAIVDALLRLMARTPYDSITIKQIAAEADVAEKTVQRHFGAKGAILVAYGHQVFAAVRAQLLASANGRSPRSTVEQLVGAVYSQYELHGDVCWQFITAASRSPEMADQWSATRAFGDMLAATVVDAWPEVWRFDRRRTCEVLAGLTRLLAWKVLREECGLDLEEAVHAATETITRSLMKVGVSGEEAIERASH